MNQDTQQMSIVTVAVLIGIAMIVLPIKSCVQSQSEIEARAISDCMKARGYWERGEGTNLGRCLFIQGKAGDQ